MTPKLNPGEYVFTSAKDLDNVLRADTLFEFKEAEGITLIIDRKKADSLGLPYSYVTAWITLTVHSSLEAVGFTAAFSAAMADENISCNVVAAYYHDHIFVPQKDAGKAVGILEALAKN